MKYDVVTIGNAVIDVFLTFTDTNQALSLNKVEKLLCVPYGQKILVDTSHFLLGGNACNVAVGLSRAGFATALMAELASDEFSEKIMHGLALEQVATNLIQRSAGQSSFSIGLNFAGERTLFVEHHDRVHDFSFSSLEAKLLYLTSLGHHWQHVYKRVGEYLHHHPESVLAFNPGTVQYLDGVASFRFILPYTTILFVNKEEAEKLVGKKLPVSDLLKQLQALGPKIICLTDGVRGAYAITENGNEYHQERISCPVVERTGAGDAFATGFLAAYLVSCSVAEAMEYGAHNAASVIGQIGSQPGLLTQEEYAMKSR